VLYRSLLRDLRLAGYSIGASLLPRFSGLDFSSVLLIFRRCGEKFGVEFCIDSHRGRVYQEPKDTRAQNTRIMNATKGDRSATCRAGPAHASAHDRNLIVYATDGLSSSSLVADKVL
jgi:hypothetical protein